ncbi:MAG: hypothetical protein JNM66_13040 [Bryobacterales bacterium]|nr:hypothetical protein [Bryobacterales bacterium]
MSSTVVCIGVACHDTIAVAAGAVVPDGRIVASEIVEAGGGNAATAAVALARLGIGVSFIGRVGRDETGERIGAGLAGEGVDVAGLKGTEGRTGRSVIIVNPETGQRSIVTYSGAAVTMTLTVDELEACAAAEWVHVDQTGFRVVRQLREAGIQTPVSLDGGTVVAGLDLGLVDMYAPTRNELLRTMGTGDLEEALGRALAAGPRMVAVTCGEEGSVGAVRGEVLRVPAFAPPVMVSTLGAGDVFHGALLAGLVEGMGVGDALRYANGAAALACRAMDGRSGIPGRGELRGFVGLDF